MSEFNDSFQLNWHDNTVVITPASDIENLNGTSLNRLQTS